MAFSTNASVNCSLYFDATMQIRTFGPMIRGFGGNAVDMGGVWPQETKKSTDAGNSQLPELLVEVKGLRD
jgi:hypothetical protein